MTELPMFVLYGSPRDYPGQYVVRRQVVVPGGIVADSAPLIVSPSLEAARAALPPGVVRLARDPDDDPAILEVWV